MSSNIRESDVHDAIRQLYGTVAGQAMLDNLPLTRILDKAAVTIFMKPGYYEGDHGQPSIGTVIRQALEMLEGHNPRFDFMPELEQRV